MTALILGLVLWTGAHLLGVLAPDRRAALTSKLGKGPAKGLMAVAILGSVVLMVWGYQEAEFIPVWTPPGFLIHLNNLLMILAIFVFIARDIPSPVRRRLRHPQLAGAKIWAVAHLLVNGDLASIVLFGGLLGWAVVAMIGANRRDGPRGELPAAAPNGLIVHLALTAVVFAVITYIHGFLLGVWPFPV